MIGRTLLLLCFVATLPQVYPNGLNRDFKFERSPFRSQLNDVVTKIRNTDIRAAADGLLNKHPNETVDLLADLLNSNQNPSIDEILDIFNYNFESKLLVVKGDNVQIDLSGFNKLFSDQAKVLARSIYPKNIFSQLILYGFLQKQIQLSTQQLQPEFESRKVPVARITALIATDGHRIAKRETLDLSSLFGSIALTVCDSLVTLVYPPINDTFNTVESYLDGIDVSGDDNVIVSLISLAVSVLKELLVGLQEIVQALSESICGTLLDSSRKRRDVAAVESHASLSRAVMTREDVALGGVLSSLLSLVWSFVTSLINTTLTNLASNWISNLESLIASFLDSTVLAWVTEFINSLFPSS